MKLKYLTLILSIVGIFILYFISELSQTQVVAISQLPKYEGKQVTIKGIVKEHHLTKYGSQIIKIEDGNFSSTVFLEGSINVEYGDKIEATGEVQKYQDGWEILVNDNRYVKVIEKWENFTTPLWELAENPLKYLDLNVNVTGYIESISNSNFNIVDEDDLYSLFVLYNKAENITIHSGQIVTLFGKFTYDLKNLRYKLEVNSEKHFIKPLEEEN